MTPTNKINKKLSKSSKLQNTILNKNVDSACFKTNEKSSIKPMSKYCSTKSLTQSSLKRLKQQNIVIKETKEQKRTCFSNLNSNSINSTQENQEKLKIENLKKLLESIKLLKHQFHLNSQNCKDDSQVPINLNKEISKSNSQKLQKNCSSPVKKLIKLEQTISSDPLSKPFFGHQSFLLKSKIDSLETRLNNIQVKNEKYRKSLKFLYSAQNQSNKESCEENFLKKLCEEILVVKKQLVFLNKKLSSFEFCKMKKDKNQNQTHLEFKKINNTQNSNSKQTKNLNTNDYFSFFSNLKIRIEENETGTHFIFENGDELIIAKDNTVIYKHSNGCKQMYYQNGERIVEFPYGQIERTSCDGQKSIYYSNNTQRIIYPNGCEEVITNDSASVRILFEKSEKVEQRK